MIRQLTGTGTITDDSTTPGVTRLIVEGGNFYEGHIADGPVIGQDGRPVRHLALDKIGPYNLILTAWNTYTAGTTIAAGSTLEMRTGGSIIGDVVNDGCLLFAADGSTPLTFTGNISGDGWVAQATTAPLTLSGVISGGITIANYGTGSLTLAGDNTFTGGLYVCSTVYAGSDTALGAATNAVCVYAGGTLDLNGHSASIGCLTGPAAATITANSTHGLIT